MVGAMLPMVMTLLSRPTVSNAAPRANTAEMIGMSMDSSDPKAISRMTAAAAMPISSLKEVLLAFRLWMALPPSSTCRPASRAASAVSTTCWMLALSRFMLWSVNTTVAKAVRPSLLICDAPGCE